MSPRHIPVFEPNSPQAAALSHLFIVVLIACACIFAVVVLMLGASLWRYRGRDGDGEPRQVFGHRNLEILWTVVPFLIVVWLTYLTVRGIHSSDPDPTSPKPDLVVVGHQWWWEIRYPKAGIVTANEIHIPVGKRWYVGLESADVVHDFWVPALARKMDMIPGWTNHIWLEADSPGTYQGSCNEYCGAEHARMRFLVIAQTPAQYEAWLHEQEKPEPPPMTASAKRGMQEFKDKTCANCHAIRGASVAGNAAPDLTHLATRRTLAADTLPNTPANLTRWLKDPQAIKPACLMPTLNLTDQQARDLVNYLEERN